MYRHSSSFGNLSSSLPSLASTTRTKLPMYVNQFNRFETLRVKEVITFLLLVSFTV